ALSCYEGNKFILVSTEELKVPIYIKDYISASGKTYVEYKTLEEAIPQLDVLYMTRIQRERFASPEEYEAQKDVYCLDKEKMKLARKNLIVLHPLPRVDEIAVEVDDDPRALYFKQANYGMYVRMALILSMLDYKMQCKPILRGEVIKDVTCTNPKCICHTEPYLPHSFRRAGDVLECEYCDTRILL
ncbi:MAG: aspartate carbamoyltransferase, partial [Ruminiclostridium sp.]|nr:aspartate carbamoyltransferase [Ruminiclostridium sp.]